MDLGAATHGKAFDKIVLLAPQESKLGAQAGLAAARRTPAGGAKKDANHFNLQS